MKDSDTIDAEVEVTWRVTEYTKGYPILEIIENQTRKVAGFSLRPVEEDAREWLIGLLVEQFRECANRNRREGRLEIRNALRNIIL